MRDTLHNSFIAVASLLLLNCCLDQVWHCRLHERPGTRRAMEAVAALVQGFDLQGCHGHLRQWLRSKPKLLR
jgi:GrpB-like predicted nucleotidyltransferase (UPF0157 family)